MAGKHSTAVARRQNSLPANVLSDRVITKLREAETALQAATSIDQVKLVADVAAAQQVFAHRQKLGEDIIGYAHAIKIHALARLGELLRDLPKAGPQHSSGGGSKGSKRVPLPDAPSTLADLGLDKKTSAVAQRVAAMPAKTREAVAQREKTIAQVTREIRREEMV